jgi:hypothetical protein
MPSARRRDGGSLFVCGYLAYLVVHAGIFMT